MIELFFLYSNHIILQSILYLYFWPILQNAAEMYGLVLPTENSKSIRGKKKQMFCAHAPCCHEVLLMLIGKYKRQACFANQTCPLKYAAQNCAWMDIPTWWNWFNEVFYSKIRRRACHPVLSLMDNYPGILRNFKGRMLWWVILLPM